MKQGLNYKRGLPVGTCRSLKVEQLSIPCPGLGLCGRPAGPSYQQEVPGKAITSFFSRPHLPEIPRLGQSSPGRPKLQRCLLPLFWQGRCPDGALCQPHRSEPGLSNLPSHGQALEAPPQPPLSHTQQALSVCTPELKYLPQQIRGPSASPGVGRGSGSPVREGYPAGTCPGQDVTGYVLRGLVALSPPPRLMGGARERSWFPSGSLAGAGLSLKPPIRGFPDRGAAGEVWWIQGHRGSPNAPNSSPPPPTNN